MSEWISVYDKLPGDEIGRVLVCVDEQSSLGRFRYVWNCSHSNGIFSDNFKVYNVSHWMPVPELPQ